MREADEIIPVSAEQSATLDNDEAKYGAGRAIDLYLGTRSKPVPASDGTTWLKVTLDRVYCIEQVIWYRNDGTPFLTWTCTDTDCSNCVGGACNYYTLTVSTEGAVSDLSPVSDCKYGDTVKLERVDGSSFNVYEIAIVGKSGNLPFMPSLKFTYCTLKIKMLLYCTLHRVCTCTDYKSCVTSCITGNVRIIVLLLQTLLLHDTDISTKLYV